jgi:nicotinate phosphoribosyltransferase
MAYAYFEAGKHGDTAVFDVFFRKNPFHGEYAVFAGLDEVLRFLDSYRFSEADLRELRHILGGRCSEAFFEYLADLDLSKLKVSAVPEGSVVFPRVPLLRLEGPVGIVQLLETTVLNLVNYASLVVTNAARHRQAVGPSKTLLEFGLRRAQGPDGGVSASRYSYIGGFDATSNVAAGALFGMPVKGTHAHSFVSSFTSLDEVRGRELPPAEGSAAAAVGGAPMELAAAALRQLEVLRSVPALRALVGDDTNRSELAAFCAYALAFPHGFLALVDTYDTVSSGLPNFIAVALALHELGYQALGLRLDSGDLAYLSKQCREVLSLAGQALGASQAACLARCQIVASNDIHEDVLLSLNEQRHAIDAFGIGTHLVTCYKQPALGCVYKLVDINGKARIKLSEDVEKVTIPGRKQAFRIYGKEGMALLDLIMGENEEPPQVGQRILCRHPFAESKRAYVIPSRVERLLDTVWDGGLKEPLPAKPDLTKPKERCHESLSRMRTDHIRALNPTPYKVSVSDSLYSFIHQLWLEEAPVGELS